MTKSEIPRTYALVLGAAVWADEKPSPSLRRRAEHAAALWHQGKVQVIVASGGIGRFPPSEAEIICRVCQEAGVPEQALRQEDLATNTEENLRLSLPILRDADAVILVTDRHHAARARLVARRLGLNARSDCPISGLRPRQRIRAILRETIGYMWYWLRGKGR